MVVKKTVKFFIRLISPASMAATQMDEMTSRLKAADPELIEQLNTLSIIIIIIIIIVI